MNSEEFQQSSAVSGRPSVVVTLSKWVNERSPALTGILTAHDVARLAKRPRWALPALSLLGLLPEGIRFHGRRVGWNRKEIERWVLRRNVADAAAHTKPSPRRPRCLCRRERRYAGKRISRGSSVPKEPTVAAREPVTVPQQGCLL